MSDRSVASLALIQAYHPRSFHERGLAAPFTTPLLAGARLRRVLTPEVLASERRMTPADEPPGPADLTMAEVLLPAALEVTVPNPSGGRGVYILPWSDVGGLCRPTMHDLCLGQMLVNRLTLTQDMSPATLRQAARDVALQGLAGRPAARAAQAALDTEAHLRLETRAALLHDLLQALEPAAGTAAVQNAAENEHRGLHALALLGARIQTAPAIMMERLEFLTGCLVDIGIGASGATAAVPRLLADLQQMRSHLMEWSQSESGQREQALRCLTAILTALERTMALIQATHLAARSLLRDVPGLLVKSVTQPDEISDLCARPLWIMDGWEQISLLWLTAYSVAERTRTIHDIVGLIPIMPDEMEGWLNLPVGTSARLNHRGPAPVAPFAAVGATRAATLVVDRIARNEHIRALAG